MKYGDWRDEYQNLIERLVCESLNDWEFNFIESIEDKLAKNINLSRKQIEN